MGGTFIVPSPAGSRWTEIESAPVALARSSQGRLFEKHILDKGPLIHPKTGERIQVDDQFVAQMMRNFENNVCDIVQVPLANDKNEHVESPAANLGEVIGLRERAGKVYAVIDARQDADKFGKTYLGASAFLSTNYTDSRTGRRAGPTLLHVAVTNRPYVTGLEPYKEIIAATADSDSDSEFAVLTPEETKVPRTLDEITAELAEHGIDLAALQAAAAAPPTAVQPTVDQSSLTAALTAALQANAPSLGLSNDAETVTQDDLVGAVVELSRQNQVISEGYQTMRRERAAETVDGLIKTGHILPKQREFAIKLSLSSPEDFADFVPAEPVVPVGVQAGLTVPRDERESAEQAEEVVRLTEAYTEFFDGSATPNRRRR